MVVPPRCGGDWTGSGAGAVSPGSGTSEASIAGGGAVLFGQESVFGVLNGAVVDAGGAAVATLGSAGAPMSPATSAAAANDLERLIRRVMQVLIACELIRRAPGPLRSVPTVTRRY
ncbi:hypothetical protein [Nocardia wallacei]|uniref:hypothetical protein n=1 Tax=Nocardia wallacei TaxID=480035 RepID=UPI0024545054|nr:hypothetical protein [Nocardia wallacei]